MQILMQHEEQMLTASVAMYSNQQLLHWINHSMELSLLYNAGSDLGKLQHGESQVDGGGQSGLHCDKLALMLVDLCLPLRETGLLALALHQLSISAYALDLISSQMSLYGFIKLKSCFVLCRCFW